MEGLSLKGNLADEALLYGYKPADSMQAFKGLAVCFNDKETCMKAVGQSLVQPGQVIVLRYIDNQDMSEVLEALRQQKLHNLIPIITDGKLNQTVSDGWIIRIVKPSARAQGRIALLRDGDTIEGNCQEGALYIYVADLEMDYRRQEQKRG